MLIFCQILPLFGLRFSSCSSEAFPTPTAETQPAVKGSFDYYEEIANKQIEEFLQKCSIYFNDTKNQGKRRQGISLSVVAFSTVFSLFSYIFVVIIMKTRKAVELKPNDAETIPQKAYCLFSLNQSYFELFSFNPEVSPSITECAASWDTMIEDSTFHRTDKFDEKPTKTYLPPASDFEFFDKVKLPNQNTYPRIGRSLFLYENWY